MSQNANSTSTPLPTARKARRASQRNRPVLVSTTSEGTQESQGSQVETLEPEIEHTPAVPVKAQLVSRLPRFFSKVEKTQEEPETSQEEVVKARLARAQKTPPKAEVTSAASKTKEDEKKPAPSPAATGRPNKLFKTRHFIGMMIYLFGAQTLLPLEANLLQNAGLESVWLKFDLFNIPMTITTSVFLNLTTLVILLLTLVKLDLLPRSMTGRTAAARAQQGEQQTVSQRQQQPTVRQGVKGEHDDLYHAYRSNQRREKKH